MKQFKFTSLLMFAVLFFSCEKDKINSEKGGNDKSGLIKAEIVFDKTYDINSLMNKVVENNNNDLFMYSEGDGYIMKVDRNGNEIWTKEKENPRDLAPTKDGGCIIITTEKKSKWSSDLIYSMIKIGSDGSFEWKKSGPDYELSKIVVGDNDEIYGIGDNEFQVSEFFKNRRPKFFKYTYDGEYLSSQWLIETKERLSYQTMCMLRLKNNKFVIGTFNSLSAERSDYNYNIIEFDIDGKNINERHYGGYKEDYIMNISETPDEGLILVGYSHSKDGDIKSYRDELSLEIGNAWVVKLDKNRNIEWEKLMGGTDGSVFFHNATYHNQQYLVGFEANVTDVDFKSKERYKSGLVTFDEKGNIVDIKYINVWSRYCEFSSKGELILLSDENDNYYNTYKPRLIKIK